MNHDTFKDERRNLLKSFKDSDTCAYYFGLSVSAQNLTNLTRSLFIWTNYILDLVFGLQKK